MPHGLRAHDEQRHGPEAAASENAPKIRRIGLQRWTAELLQIGRPQENKPQHDPEQTNRADHDERLRHEPAASVIISFMICGVMHRADGGAALQDAVPHGAVLFIKQREGCLQARRASAPLRKTRASARQISRLQKPCVKPDATPISDQAARIAGYR